MSRTNGNFGNSWGFHEQWPSGAKGPVFDVMQGSTVIARMEQGGEGWRLTVRQSTEAANNLTFLLQMLSIMSDRMRSVEGEDGKLTLVAESQSGETLAGADVIRRLLDALQTPEDNSDAVAWGAHGGEL